MPSARARPRTITTKARKYGTETTKKHRFQSFSQRVAKIHIDPARKRKETAVHGSETEENSFSYTVASLHRWRDLNNSETFRGFAREIDGICQTLPQVIHFEQRIFDKLISTVEKSDEASLQPLLDLLANFARDLGSRFERHFATSVNALSSLVTKNASVEVTEWSFDCLAWLFKHLQRLLVPDLKPLIESMQSLLGKNSQKPHIIRFAAEALSFLIKRAAIVYHHRPRYLSTAIHALLANLPMPEGITSEKRQNGNVSLHKQGILTVLLYAMKGIDKHLHSGALNILEELWDILSRQEPSQQARAREVLSNVLVGLVHFTQQDSFQPIFDFVVGKCHDQQAMSSNLVQREMLAHSIFIIVTVRKGTRIADWKSLFEASLTLSASENDTINRNIISCCTKSFASMFCFAPGDLALRYSTSISDRLEKVDASEFILLSKVVMLQAPDRFSSILLPSLCNVMKNADDSLRLQFLQLTSSIVRTGIVLRPLPCPQSWQEYHLSSLGNVLTGDESDIQQTRLFMSCISSLALSAKYRERFLSVLSRVVDKMIKTAEPSPARRRLLGLGLLMLTESDSLSAQDMKDWWSLLEGDIHFLGTDRSFVLAISAFAGSPDILQSMIVSDPLFRALKKNLVASTKDLKRHSLLLLEQLETVHVEKSREAYGYAQKIDSAGLDTSSVRMNSMYIRKLSVMILEKDLSRRAESSIIAFAFGLLHHRLSQTRHDALDIFRAATESADMEQEVADVAFGLLMAEETMTEEKEDYFQTTNFDPSDQYSSSEFTCSNFSLMQMTFDKCKGFQSHDSESLGLGEVDASPESMSQSQMQKCALQVMHAVPHIAERRSRLLVPIFLACTSRSQESFCETGDAIKDHEVDEAEIEMHFGRASWLKNSMVELFSLFKNPVALYKSEEVYASLLAILMNGDLSLQKSALEAILRWKQTAVQNRREMLFNLLDDTRLREELAHLGSEHEFFHGLDGPDREIFTSILLRLLYGRAVARNGKSRQHGGQTVNRRIILETIGQLPDQDVNTFIDISLPREIGLKIIQEGELSEGVLEKCLLSSRHQLGVVNMIHSLSTILPRRLQHRGPMILSVLVLCLIKSSCTPQSLDLDDRDESKTCASTVSIAKDVVQTGISCLRLLSICLDPEEIRPFLPIIFKNVLDVRIARLSIESAQSISGILRLLTAWASEPTQIDFLVEFNKTTICSIGECLTTPFCKEEVKLFILENTYSDIAQAIMADETQRKAKFERYNGADLIEKISAMLIPTSSPKLTASAINVLTALAPANDDISTAKTLLETVSGLLQQPVRQINLTIKSNLLKLSRSLLDCIDHNMDAVTLEQFHTALADLAPIFCDRKSRTLLVDAQMALSKRDQALAESAELCRQLNSWSNLKVDEPDFESRLKAFNSISKIGAHERSPMWWRPIIHNLLYFVKDEQEMAIRSHATANLVHFIESSVSEKKAETTALIEGMILKCVQKGMSERSELVRVELLSIWSRIVYLRNDIKAVQGLENLLVGNDEEASFFSNILHIQHHRRLRALRRLVSGENLCRLQSSQVAHYLLPLIEHFVYAKADDDAAENLSAQAVVTIISLCPNLEWNVFRAVFQRYISYISSKPDVLKATTKLLSGFSEALFQTTLFPNQHIKEGLQVEAQTSTANHETLRNSRPPPDKLTEVISQRLIKPLTAFLHDKDESTVSLRVPVAIAVCKLLKACSAEYFKRCLPSVLTDICNILRSRAQESRDLARNTLAEISQFIGVEYFGFILQELKTALTRGYQVHVLSYTLHSILVSNSGHLQNGDLDYCAARMMTTLMEDIFGAAGQEKDADEYTNKMREIKSRKSFDSIEIVARLTMVEHLMDIIRPIQAVLPDKFDLSIAQKLDEVLRRVHAGLSGNAAMKDQRLLIFCHEMIRHTYAEKVTESGPSSAKAREDGRFLIAYSGANRTANRGSTSNYNFKMARLALDILRSAFTKADEVRTPANVHGFIPIIGDALLQDNEEIQIAALRLLAAVMKVPLRSLEENAGLYVSECVKIVKNSTNIELLQAAIKVMTSILRDRPGVSLREADLGHLLRHLMNDIREADRQSLGFGLLKSILSRKVLLPEVYEVIDEVESMMIVSQSKSARDMARGAYFQFLMEYPLTSSRFTKHVQLLVKNLEYRYPEGRKSVMEVTLLLLSKIDGHLLKTAINLFFVPLVMRMVNDEDCECREMAGQLLKTSLERAEENQFTEFLSMIRTWIDRNDHVLLNRAAVQLCCIALGSDKAMPQSWCAEVHEQVSLALRKELKKAQGQDWESIFYILKLQHAFCSTMPKVGLGLSSRSMWRSTTECLAFPHVWVKSAAAELFTVYFADLARNYASIVERQLPLHGSHGLMMNEKDLVSYCRPLLSIIAYPGTSKTLAEQSVRNLSFITVILLNAETVVPWPVSGLTTSKSGSDAEQFDGESQDQDQDQARTNRPAIMHIMTRCSNILRQPPTSTQAQSMVPLTSALHLLSLIVKQCSNVMLTENSMLPTILLPLSNLTDTSASIPFSTDPAFTTEYKALVQNCRELLSELQDKLGVTEFIDAMQKVKMVAKERREQRRTKRAIQRVGDPTRANLDKRRKLDKKREKRKERSGQERARRLI